VVVAIRPTTAGDRRVLIDVGFLFKESPGFSLRWSPGVDELFRILLVIFQPWRNSKCLDWLNLDATRRASDWRTEDSS
jgi:hypothetical protein